MVQKMQDRLSLRFIRVEIRLGHCGVLYLVWKHTATNELSGITSGPVIDNVYVWADSKPGS